MVFCSYMSFLNPNHVLKYFLERKVEKGKGHRLVFFSLLHCCTTNKCHIQVHLSRNNVPMVKPPLNHTSLPSIVATFLTTRLMVVLQSSGYSVFHGGDTPIQLSLLWRSYFCQCLNTETSTQAIGVFPLKPRASPIISVCI